jgi:tRNA(fMet)-specific endonuclease VapC
MEPKNLVLCSVVKAELLFGAVKSQATAKNLARLEQFFSVFDSYPFDDRAANVYAGVRADLETRGIPIGANDLLIASIAMAREATVVTANRREFARVDGLRWEDWEFGGGGGS